MLEIIEPQYTIYKILKKRLGYLSFWWETIKYTDDLHKAAKILDEIIQHDLDNKKKSKIIKEVNPHK